jgi:hypothetical protein
MAGVFCCLGVGLLEVAPEVITPGPDGCIDTDEAARLCGVSPITVRNWINRGWHDTDGNVRKLPVASRWKGRIRLDPVEVAKADYATARKARRIAALI